MISLDNIEEVMKKISDNLKKKCIFVNPTWLKQKFELYKNKEKVEEFIYKDIINTDIIEFIDKENLKSPSLEEKFILEKGNIFLQINGYFNIAESKENMDRKTGDNLFEVLENFESKFLQSEEDEIKKVEKTVLKFEFTDGKNLLHGFEYEDLKDFRNAMIEAFSTNKFLKVLVGPNYEIRRGIIYLKRDNIKLL